MLYDKKWEKVKNYKTPEELNIKSDVHQALIKLMCMLRSGEIKHRPLVTIDEAVLFPKTPAARSSFLFNMRYWCKSTKNCGTIMCIGGWLEHMMGKSCYHHMAPNFIPGALHALFNPPMMKVPWDFITPTQASQAIENYLTTGEPNWIEIING